MAKILLDVKDKKILSKLEDDCRMPLSALSKEVGLSREVVNYRIKQLESKKIIESYVLTIDFVRLGLMFCRMFYRFSHVSNEIEKAMIEYARKNPYVAWMALGDGDMNLALVYIANNLNILEDYYYDFLLKYGGYLKNSLMSIAFRIFNFKHTYLHGDPNRVPVVIGANKDVIPLEKGDYKVLLELMNDPKINILDLGKKVEMSTKTVNNKIKFLTENKIILGFRVKINTRVLGLEHHKVYLFLENMTREKLNLLISYLSHCREVIFITVPLSNAHLEFELIVEGKVQIFEFMKNLNLNFPNLIRDYESFLMYSEPFTNYIPKIALKN